MTKTQKDKMTLGRMKRNSSRINISLKGIKIKSYDHGFQLFIGNEDPRYYSSLQDLFKKLFDIKLSRKSADSLEQCNRVQMTCLKEIRELVLHLEQVMLNK